MGVQTYEVTGDRELWLIYGEEICIPVFAQTASHAVNTEQLVRVQPAIHLGIYPDNYMTGVLAELSIAHEPGNFILTRKSLEEYLDKAPGITPEFYYRWQSEITPKLTKERDSVPENKDRPSMLFLKSIAAHCQPFTPQQVFIFMRAFERAMLEQLFSKADGVDLGFCKMIALPYRINWKMLLTKRFPKLAWCFNRNNPDVGEKALTAMGVTKHMMDPALLEMDGKVVRWNIEVIPKKPFLNYAAKRELKQFKRGKYAAAVARRIVERKTVIIAALQHFCARARQPFARIREGSVPGSQMLSPHTTHARVSPVSVEDSSADICMDAGDEFSEPRFAESFGIASQAVPEMPDVERTADDMRIAGGDIDGL